MELISGTIDTDDCTDEYPKVLIVIIKMLLVQFWASGSQRCRSWLVGGSVRLHVYGSICWSGTFIRVAFLGCTEPHSESEMLRKIYANNDQNLKVLIWNSFHLHPTNKKLNVVNSSVFNASLTAYDIVANQLNQPKGLHGGSTNGYFFM